MTTDLTRSGNKQTVRDFYRAAFADRDFAEVRRLVGDRYVQHSPGIADGVDGLIERLTYLKDAFPAMRVEVTRLIAEGDQVAAYARGVFGNDRPDLAIVDIFRLDNGKLVEHWDVRQDVPAEARNANGMF